MTDRPKTIKLTGTERLNLAALIEAQWGLDAIRGPLDAVLGKDRADLIVARESADVTKAEMQALSDLLLPLIPVADDDPAELERKRVEWLVDFASQAFEDMERFAEVVAYARHRVDEWRLSLANPPPAPVPVGPPEFADDIPLSGVTFVGHDIRDWPAIYDLDVSVAGGKVTFRQKLTKELPGKDALANGTPLSGNAWVIANVGGGWHSNTWEWFKEGQTVKSAKALAGDHIKSAPFPALWRPASGETVYLAASGLARNRHRNSKVRTPFRKVVWP